ncbi:hypothetical protein [uncultured Tateyamaria sp.]|uniref:hypothetical protein n=1 Tax=uncultured Tateyamaria sp. TaxID=455651 RepID=UPI00262D26EB|nr:hypothetical protein [uncultured Tateyamaria sp.]
MSTDVALPPDPGLSEIDSLEYIASFEDLANSFGGNVAAGNAHYQNEGHTEGRDITFSAEAYLAANPDLQEELGTDVMAAALHYINIGRFEGRPLTVGAAASTPHQTTSGAQVTLNGEAVTKVSSATEGAISLLNEWVVAGLITEEQEAEYAANEVLLTALQKMVDAGGGVVEFSSQGKLALEELLAQTEDQIVDTLARGFTLETGPAADQLAALHLLSFGHSTGFYELLMNWTLKHQDKLTLEFDYYDGKGEFFFEVDGSKDDADGNAFLDWMETKLKHGDAHKYVELEYFRDGRDHAKGTGHTSRKGRSRKKVRSSESMTITFETMSRVLRDHDAQDRVNVLGRVFGWDEKHPARGMHVGGMNRFDIDDNSRKDPGGYGGAMFREAMDLMHPEFTTGSDVFVVNADHASVVDDTEISDTNVIVVGGDSAAVQTRSGDTTVALSDTNNTDISTGAGGSVITANGTDGLTITDTDDQSSNSVDVQGQKNSIIAFSGENANAHIITDEGINAIIVGNGTLMNLNAETDGETFFGLQAGAALLNGNIEDHNELEFNAQAGSLVDGFHLHAGDDDDTLIFNGQVTNSVIRAGDDDDTLVFNGQNVGNIVRTGDGNDYVDIGPEFRGNFGLEDSASSWMWMNGDEIFENDTVVLRHPSMLEGMQSEGWQLIDDDKLVAYDTDGSILAQINLTGDAENIEGIFASDGQGGFTALQQIPPEVRVKLSWLGTLSTVLMAVGAVFPPAAIAGAAARFAYDVANDNVSFTNALMTGAAVASAGSAGGAGQALAPKWVAPALQGGAAAINGDWENFAQNVVLTAAGAQAEGLFGLDGLPIEFAKLSNTVEAGIMVVDGIESGSAFEVAEGVFLLGASVSDQGTTQLLLGGADATKIGEAIESGDLGPLLGVGLSFLQSQGFFGEQTPPATIGDVTYELADVG